MADVQKSAFSLSSATIMLGQAFVDDAFAMTPVGNSIGMVSDVTVNLDSSLNELMNGVAQAVVDSKRTGLKSALSASVYEFTAQNMMRANAMVGQATQIKRGVITAAVAGGAASITINSDPVPGEPNSAITGVTDLPAGATILIQRVNGQQDYVFPTKTSAVATGSGPYTIALAAPYTVPAGMSFNPGDRVWVVSPVAFGNIDADSLFCVKVTGILSSYDRPVTAVFPKVKIVKGATLTFNEKQYSSMAWEMQPLLMSLSEVGAMPRLADIGTRSPGQVFIGG